nr:metallophosphoesterase [Lachnospiraceae bacterium]
MKFIHCSDIHLDASMTSISDPKKAEGRRNEVLLTFVRMVRYARKHNIRAILIAGDLFDSERIFFSTMDIVKDCITGNPEIDFLYTTGDKEN